MGIPERAVDRWRVAERPEEDVLVLGEELLQILLGSVPVLEDDEGEVGVRHACRTLAEAENELGVLGHPLGRPGRFPDEIRLAALDARHGLDRLDDLLRTRMESKR